MNRSLMLTGGAIAVFLSGEFVEAQSGGGAAFAFVQAQDGKPGSTMTLSELQQGPKKAEESVAVLRVRAAAEPTPALRYSLYPSHWDLKPGRAELHFARVLIAISQVPKEKRQEWEQWAPEVRIPSDAQLAEAVQSLNFVFSELHLLAMCEDLTWDHRIRDLQGPQIYSYLLPDVQEVRAMARLLSLKAEHQRRQQDFEGVCSTVSDGFRLAEFVGQGETLIQKLVGIAVSAIMRTVIERTIETENCPNLYWAIARIPRPLINISESVLWELRNVNRVFPVLAEAESATWTEAEAAQKWGALIEDLKVLGGMTSADSTSIQLKLAIASLTLAGSAKERLTAAGLSSERLNKMSALQIVLADAGRELRRAGDAMAKSSLLPASLAAPLSAQSSMEFDQWVQNQSHNSVGAAIAGVLFPAFRQAREAETRTLVGQHRLMTLEAIRMHAAEHDGQPPESLDRLSPVPAMPDPYTDRPFEYRVEKDGERFLITLRAAGPQTFRPLQELRVELVK